MSLASIIVSPVSGFEDEARLLAEAKQAQQHFVSNI
jgi:hypothetical protein